MKSKIRCATDTCRQSIEKYGEHYHAVVDAVKVMDSGYKAIARCELCGGYTSDGKEWEHQCSRCKKHVQPGELRGLFVPHLCKECEQAIADRDIQSGNICTMCGDPRSRCCC